MRHWLLSRARRSRWPHVQLFSFISFSTVLLHVSFGLPLFLRPSEVHLRATRGSAAGGMRSTWPTISISFAGLAVWLVLFLFFCATHSLRVSGASIYGASCAGTCSGRLLTRGWWFWSSSRILRHIVECSRHCFWRIGSLSSGWFSWISKCLEARRRPGLPLKSGLGSLLRFRWWTP